MRTKVLFLCLLAVSAAKNTVAGQLPESSPLYESLEQFRGDPALRYADWALYVRNVSSGAPVAMHNINQFLVPASSQKLVISHSAQTLLGSDWVYRTFLEHDGTIEDDGVLHGNLYIRGSGDPAFGSVRMDDSLSLDTVFAQWMTALTEAGIQKVNGHVIADERTFDNEMVSRRWLWEDIGNYFGAGASGLTANENEYTVYFNPGETVGDPAAVAYTDPVVPGMTFINEVTTGPPGSGDRVYIFGAPYISERLLTGTVPLGSAHFPVRGAMHDPPGFVSESFRTFLIHNGIPVAGRSTSYRNAASDGVIPSDERQPVDTWTSPRLFDILHRTNTESVNTFSENLLKTIGRHVAGEGSTSAGLQVIEGLWDSYDMYPPLTRLVDGSGLSPVNRMTVSQLMHILSTAAQQPEFTAFVNSLPLAGRSGSLRNHLRGSASDGVLRAKSGTMRNVLSYAGYTSMQNGDLAAFVIIVNNYEGRPAEMRLKMLQLLDSITRHDGN